MGAKDQKPNADICHRLVLQCFNTDPFGSLERKTLTYIKEMGTTGAGIEHEEDIDMSQVNSFTTRWGKCH